MPLEKGNGMNEIMAKIAAFAAGTGFWVYAFIFFWKMAEVSLCTLRIVLINRGVRALGALIGFVEMMLWLIVASSVLAGLSEDFTKGIIYAVAFAAGNYAGSWLDELLAFGLSSLQVVISDAEEAKKTVDMLREHGFGVTTMDVHGRTEDHFMLMMTVKRRRLQEAIRLIHTVSPGAVISMGDVKAQQGAYLQSAGKGIFRKAHR